jgi:rhodanese-related sulfurtransferase
MMMKHYRDLWACTTLAVLCLLPLLTGLGCPAFRADIGGDPAQIQSVTPTEAQTLIQSHQNDPDFIILDVRTPEEFATGHLQNATNVSVNAVSPTFTAAIAGFDKSRTYLVYCKAGSRSATATGIMTDEGFANIYTITGGITAWQSDGLPVVQ